MNYAIAALFNADQRKRVADEAVDGLRRVGLHAARRAVENDRDPIEASYRARLLYQEGAHGGALGPIVDDVAGPLNRTAFAGWMRARVARRVRLPA